MNLDVQPWHSDKSFCEKVKKFHDAYCRQPSKESPEFIQANRLLHTCLDQLGELLTGQGLFKLHRYEYRGSTYEGVKVYKDVDDPDLEFDVMFIIQGGSKLSAVSTGSPGYFNLKPAPEFKDKYPTLFSKSVDESTGCLSAKKTRETFFSQVKRAIQILETSKSAEQDGISLDTNWHLREHGPAVQIDVIRRGPPGKKLFSIDLVLQFELGNSGDIKAIYIPKKSSDDAVEKESWFRSYALQEREMFDGMDRNNGCRKQVLRILKVIRKRNELASLSSYHLKTALLKQVKAQPNPERWKQSDLGARLMDVIRQLAVCLSKHYMKHYFMQNYNLFEKFEDSAMENMKCRICRLCSNQTKMESILHVP